MSRAKPTPGGAPGASWAGEDGGQRWVNKGWRERLWAVEQGRQVGECPPTLANNGAARGLRQGPKAAQGFGQHRSTSGESRTHGLGVLLP